MGGYRVQDATDPTTRDAVARSVASEGEPVSSDGSPQRVVTDWVRDLVESEGTQAVRQAGKLCVYSKDDESVKFIEWAYVPPGLGVVSLQEPELVDVASLSNGSSR